MNLKTPKGATPVDQASGIWLGQIEAGHDNVIAVTLYKGYVYFLSQIVYFSIKYVSNWPHVVGCM